MCGLVGAIGADYVGNRKIFTQLLIIDSLRGLDSTGVCAVHQDQKYVVKKAVGDPFNLIWREDYRKKIDDAKHNIFCWLGHNRAATRGTVNHQNAHPFIHNPVILAHNGTLTSTFQLHEPMINPFGTDSEAIAAHLSKNTVQDTWSAIRGAAALSWWDIRDVSLNLVRNSERPLHFCITGQGLNLYWASEAWMLEGILERNKKAHEVVQVLKEHHHLKAQWCSEKKKLNIHISKLKEPAVPLVSQGGVNGYRVVSFAGQHHNAAGYKPKDKKKNHSTIDQKLPWKVVAMIKRDGIKNQNYVWVNGQKHYLFINPIPVDNNNKRIEYEEVETEEQTREDDANREIDSTDRALAETLLKKYPRCSWTDEPFTLETVLEATHNEFLDALFSSEAMDDPNCAEMVGMR